MRVRKQSPMCKCRSIDYHKLLLQGHSPFPRRNCSAASPGVGPHPVQPLEFDNVLSVVKQRLFEVACWLQLANRSRNWHWFDSAFLQRHAMLLCTLLIHVQSVSNCFAYAVASCRAWDQSEVHASGVEASRAFAVLDRDGGSLSRFQSCALSTSVSRVTQLFHANFPKAMVWPRWLTWLRCCIILACP